MERNRRDRTEQRLKCIRARQSSLPIKFLATANELENRQRKT